MHPLDHLNPKPVHKRLFDERGLKSIPKCVCGADVCLDYTYVQNLFRTYCSPKCSRANSKIKEEVIQKLKDYQWLYNERIALKKSKEQIAKDLNISITPVNKWLKYHAIPDVKYNESNFKVQAVLNSKVELEELYSQELTMKDIAERIGSSVATVQRFFIKHNITPRAPNSYERNSTSISDEEQLLVDWIRTIYTGEIKQGNRSLLNGREIDIYIPEKALAIEYNGLYSHLYRPNETNGSLRKDRGYHLSKTTALADQGVQLLHIFSDQWKHKQLAVQTVLQAKLGENRRVYARQCEFKEVPFDERKLFLNQYHIQGDSRSTYNFGLYLHNELLAVMTFGTPRFTKTAQWELIRFCCKQGITVVGGFSKLLKAFREQHAGAVITYADRTYSNGNVYEKNGFQLVGINAPSYFYVNLNSETRALRTTFTKKTLTKELEIDDDVSESDITTYLNLPKIWDCGTLTYILR